MDIELYHKCVICQGTGIAQDPHNPPFTTMCHGCHGKAYAPVGFNMHAIQQMIIDAREAHRYYLPDGSSVHVENADELRQLRINCARKIEALESEIGEIKQEIANYYNTLGAGFDMSNLKKYLPTDQGPPDEG